MADYLKKEKNEMISDLYRVFGPMSEIITRKYVKLLYESCYGALKDKEYVRERMSLAKVLAAVELEKLIKKEAGIEVKEPDPIEEAGLQIKTAPQALRTKRKFIP